MEKIKKIAVSVMLTPETNERLNALIKNVGMSKVGFIEKSIKMTLDKVEKDGLIILTQ